LISPPHNADYVLNKDFNFTAGQEVSAIVCLAYDENLPEGFSILSSGDYNYMYFIPLNVTDALEAEEHRVVQQYKYFSYFNILHGTVTPPATGKNYYSIADYFVLQCRDPYKTNPQLKLVFYINRDGEIITPSSGSNMKTFTAEFVKNESTGLYLYDYGQFTLSPITTVQSGDELWVEVRVIDGANEFKVHNQLLYTH
jgi:hypothetical protein